MHAEITGDFEIHLTVNDWEHHKLTAFAEENGLKITHIQLDRGLYASQQMLTLVGSGTLDGQRGTVKRWIERLGKERIPVVRTKIEAAPWNDGVPATDSDAEAQPAARYFEHHVKVLLPEGDVARLLELTDLAEAHGARPSRNPRRKPADGWQERFITQRCSQVGRTTSRARLDALVDALRAADYEVVSVEQEYVVVDNNLGLDKGWFEPRPDSNQSFDDKARSAPAGSAGYPSTYQPIPGGDGVTQRGVFDPALKQFDNAYRHGEPSFADAETGVRWRQARREAMHHILRVVADSPWSDSLVLRGSITMRAWVGDAAREPGDIDFVVLPGSLSIKAEKAAAMLDGIVDAVRSTPGAGLLADEVAAEDIWTYERADGRRLVFPFAVDGLPRGAVQLDFVFNEVLPIPPLPLEIPSVDRTLLAATPELSLAWKLMWLATDLYPQGKDLYDAVLLAERTAVPDRDLVVDLLRPEHGSEADDFGAEFVLARAIDWGNFRDEYPDVDGDGRQLLRRLALALGRAWVREQG